jgi:hypothetical protein
MEIKMAHHYYHTDFVDFVIMEDIIVNPYMYIHCILLGAKSISLELVKGRTMLNL